METAAAAAAARGSSLPMSSLQSPAARKEWRVVSEQSAPGTANEDLDGSKLGHSNERTIYEVHQGGEPVAGVDFCLIQMDGVGDPDDDFEKKLRMLVSRREQLLQMEIELRSQTIARSEIVEMKKNFNAQINEQARVAAKLQEQVHEREQKIMELERKMDEKERELHAIRLDTEAAWAKEDLLREQNKELANYRRERDNIEAERVHHMKQIHELQELMQDKERQVMELQEQHRIAQETILYKDEQLREAQVWIARVQEMDALRSTSSHSLQAELRERTEQYNQLWLACQRQFAEMERVHLQTVQQLQLELTGSREKVVSTNDESGILQPSTNGVTSFGHNSGSLLEANENGTSSKGSVNLPNGHSENPQSFASSGNGSEQAPHVHGLAITSPSLVGAASYLLPGQVTAVHPYITHQQGADQPVPTPAPQPGHYPPMQAMASYQHWQVQQVVTEGAQGSIQTPHELSQAEDNLDRHHSNFDYKIAMNGQDLPPQYRNAHLSQGTEPNSAIPSPNCLQVPNSVDKSCMSNENQPILQQLSSQFHDALSLSQSEQALETKENNGIGSNDRLQNRAIATGRSSSAATPLPHVGSATVVGFAEAATNPTADAALPEAFVSLGQTNFQPSLKALEVALLDERALLSCIVRTIPASGKVRISSTLPNRLGKMLAPLHWHDYKKKYGKLDEFVASHPELFLIEGDYIQLREGAKGMVAATAAVAKVAAAVAATSPHSRGFPTVAVTPMAHANRLKRNSPMDSKTNGGAGDGSLLPSSVQIQHLNGADRSGIGNFQAMGQFNGRLNSNFIGQHNGRLSPSRIQF